MRFNVASFIAVSNQFFVHFFFFGQFWSFLVTFWQFISNLFFNHFFRSISSQFRIIDFGLIFGLFEQSNFIIFGYFGASHSQFYTMFGHFSAGFEPITWFWIVEKPIFIALLPFWIDSSNFGVNWSNLALLQLSQSRFNFRYFSTHFHFPLVSIDYNLAVFSQFRQKCTRNLN